MNSKYSQHGIGNEFIMDDELKSLFDGLLLSDASYTARSSISACLRIEIHERNLDWLVDISNTMRNHGVESVIEKVPSRSREYLGRIIKSGPHVSLRTPMYRNLREEYDRWYPNGKKAVPDNVVINSMSVANWYMGDGSLVKNLPGNLRIKFYTNGFSKNDVNLLESRIETEFGFTGFTSFSRIGQPIMIFSARKALALLDMVRPHILSSFRHKVDDIKYLVPICALCGKKTERMNARYCASCRPVHRKALNRVRYLSDVDVGQIAVDPIVKCAVCSCDFSDRLGVKYCKKCRPDVRRAYKVVKRHLDKTSDFDFIGYVQQRQWKKRLEDQSK